MLLIRKLIFCLLLVSLSGCQMLPGGAIGDRSAQQSYGAGHYQLLASWPGPAIQLWQEVDWQQGDTQQRFFVSSYLRQGSLTLVGLSPLGNEIWRIEYAAGGEVDASGVEPFDDDRLARAILADMQLAMWPEAELQPQLTGLRLSVQPEQRQLYAAERLVLQVTTTGQSQRIKNFVADYAMTITTLTQEKVD